MLVSTAPIGGWALIYLLVSTVGAEVCFDRKTGAPLCYYADTSKGRVWSRTPGYDPKFGREYKLYTRETLERETQEREAAQREHRIAETRTQQRELIMQRAQPNNNAAHFQVENKQEQSNLKPAPASGEKESARQTANQTRNDEAAREQEQARQEQQHAAEVLARERQEQMQLESQRETDRRAEQARRTREQQEQIALAREQRIKQEEEERSERRAQQACLESEREQERRAERERERNHERTRLYEGLLNKSADELIKRLPRRRN